MAAWIDASVPAWYNRVCLMLDERGKGDEGKREGGGKLWERRVLDGCS